jgi:hypothetical protein
VNGQQPRAGPCWNDLRAFLIAVLCGSLAAGAPVMLMTVPFGLGMVSDGDFGGLLVMFSPALVALPVVLGASLLIGLPLTALLRASNREAGAYYVLAGLVFGAGPLLVWMVMPDGSPSLGILAALGGFGGAITGWQWGRYRDAVRGERTE